MEYETSNDAVRTTPKDEKVLQHARFENKNFNLFEEIEKSVTKHGHLKSINDELSERI